MEQQTEHGNGEHERLTDEELEMLDEIPIWHQKFFLNMPNYSKDGFSNIEKMRSGLDRFKSDNDARYNGAVFRIHEYDFAVRGIHEIDIIGSILSLMFPIMGFPKEKSLLRIRLLRAAGVDVTGIGTELAFKETYELDKQVISIKALRLYIECNTFFTDYLCVATLKIWQKYVDQNKNYHSGFDNAIESVLFGGEQLPFNNASDKKQPSLETLHPININPARSKLDLQAYAAISIKKSMVKPTNHQLHAECKRQRKDLFSGDPNDKEAGWENFRKILRRVRELENLG